MKFLTQNHEGSNGICLVGLDQHDFFMFNMKKEQSSGGSSIRY